MIVVMLDPRVESSFPPPTLHNCNMLFEGPVPPQASDAPSGENATEQMFVASCEFNVLSCVPVEVAHDLDEPF